MHISLAPLVPAAESPLPAADLALLVAALARAAGEATDPGRAVAADPLLAPVAGAFNAAMAARLAAWADGGRE